MEKRKPVTLLNLNKTLPIFKLIFEPIILINLADGVNICNLNGNVCNRLHYTGCLRMRYLKIVVKKKLINSRRIMNLQLSEVVVIFDVIFAEFRIFRSYNLVFGNQLFSLVDIYN